MTVYKKSLVNIPMYKLLKILNQQSMKLIMPINLMSSSKKLSKTKYESVALSLYTYSKSYIRRINHLKMLENYQPQKFNNLMDDRAHKLKTLKWQANHRLYPLLEESTSKLQREIVRVLHHRHVHTRHESKILVDNKDADQSMATNVKPIFAQVKFGRVDDPNNCKYHRLISHPLNKCFVFKDRIIQLNKERKIKFEEEHKPKQFIQNVDTPKHKSKQFIQNNDALKHELKLFNPNNDAPKHELK
ncbi:hypothetical protein ES288_A01G187300v1 [Gossypium darwinii]|uniref:Uncharacterized protein n=1 Tax=Gossypium darwinii TaxID=34276 RepID=A0A5D2HNU9_GOSDA|nr:hypothetical protein ES288_A01G187300v1 [Gossypium darwinii]